MGVFAMTKKNTLKELIYGERGIIAPSAFDAISAKIIENAGFQAISTTGFGMHGAILGQPDNGLLAYNEMLDALSKMADAVEIPIIADAEGGYGNVINVIRTVRTFEKAGLGGLFIEDQKLPPNCPHYKETELISTEEMCGKIEAAIDARESSDFIIVARSDAPFEEAVARARCYIDAGADMIKIAPQNREQLLALPRVVDAPLHLGFGYDPGINKGLTGNDMLDIGYKIVTYPSLAFFAAVKAMMGVMEDLRKFNTDQKSLDKIMSMDDYFDFIGRDRMRALEEKYLP